jgi:hypothetical protein
MDGPLTGAELRHFGTNGWVIRPVFSDEEVAALRSAADDELDAKAAAQGMNTLTRHSSSS